MNIVIFKGVTTEGVITSIEENSKKYHDGLYADMSNLPERTMVKKGAAEIGDIIKEVKAAGIKLRKSKIAEINKEEKLIVERLEVANLPFTDLLDAYNIERKKILDAEKVRKQAIIDAEQFESDHEMALLMNKTFEYDREQELKQKAEHEAKIAEQAAVDALAKQKQIDEAAKQAEIDAENARLANFNHVRTVNNEILTAMAEQTALPIEQLKLIIKAIAKQEIPYISIRY